MPDLGLEVLLKGKNLARILGGLDAALKISMISVAISIPLGIILGILMTWKIQSAGRSCDVIWNLSGLCRRWCYCSSSISVLREPLAGTCPGSWHP